MVLKILSNMWGIVFFYLKQSTNPSTEAVKEKSARVLKEITGEKFQYCLEPRKSRLEHCYTFARASIGISISIYSYFFTYYYIIWKILDRFFIPELSNSYVTNSAIFDQTLRKTFII